MKRYILGSIALILIVAASAFMKSKDDAKSPVFYWYNVNASGYVVSGSQAFMGTQETSSYASSHLPCTPGTNADCIRGFTNVPSFPTNASGDTAPFKKQ